jgi:hypothetical protein
MWGRTVTYLLWRKRPLSCWDLDCRDIQCFGVVWGGYLFKVVDLPDDGLPTRPMRGSRGILRVWKG